MREKYKVSGMSCAACQAKIEKDVSKLAGVGNVNVSLLNNDMIVDYDEALADSDKIIKAVKKAGYAAKLDKVNKTSEKNDDDPTKAMKTRLWLSVVFLIPLLYVSMGSMLKLPLPNFLTDPAYSLHFALIQMLLVIPIMIINRKFFVSGFRTLIMRAPNMDSLIALGAAAGFTFGLYNLFRIATGFALDNQQMIMNGRDNLYFEAAGAILTFITIGKYLEEKSKKRTTDAIRKLMDLAPKKALVERNGEVVEIEAAAIVVDDIVLIKPGMTIPVDGVITDGSSDLDEALITGESLPVFKQPGDKVISGTINKTGSFRFAAKGVGMDTTIAKIIELVEQATMKKIPVQKLADKISSIFVPVVILISLVAFTVWMLIGATFAFALEIAISVLVISCPCALGLATPVAIMVASGRGAASGILLKAPESLEVAHRIDTVVLDKTGTITFGKPEVTDAIIVDESVEKTDFIKMLSGLEMNSEHPLAKAIVEYAKNLKIDPETKYTAFKAVPGRGVSAILDGKKYYAGNIDYISGVASVNKLAREIFDGLVVSGKTSVLFANDSAVIGIVALRDKIKDDSKKAIKDLEKMGLEVIMLTGDNQVSAEAIRKEAGISKAIAEVLPEGKADQIMALQKENRVVAMVGDGINDAVALMQADVGIAIGAGTDVAIESADIVLMHSNLSDVQKAIVLSKKTMNIIRMNLFWAFIYNIIGIPLAAGLLFGLGGLVLSPVIASFAMSLSSVSVVLNALRLKIMNINGGK